jgi:hypothetical protein
MAEYCNLGALLLFVFHTVDQYEIYVECVAKITVGLSYPTSTQGI